MGLKTMVGVGLSENRDDNERELANGIEIARAGHANILAVGNENMLREDISEAIDAGHSVTTTGRSGPSRGWTCSAQTRKKSSSSPGSTIWPACRTKAS